MTLAVARKWQLLDIKRRGRSKGLSPLSFALMRSDAKTCARALYAPRLASGECFHCPGGQAQDWSGPEVMGGGGVLLEADSPTLAWAAVQEENILPGLFLLLGAEL